MKNRMRYLALMLIGLSAPAWAAETRCGWVENPTPANYWIVDNAGTWVISTQGGRQAEGDLAFPSDSANDYVATNGHYGYFCACIEATADATSSPRQVTKIHKAWVLPLSRCLNDKSLPNPDYRPRTLVHGSGKAYTECVDNDEVQAGFKGRQVCINKAGEYYFLAN